MQEGCSLGLGDVVGEAIGLGLVISMLCSVVDGLTILSIIDASSNVSLGGGEGCWLALLSLSCVVGSCWLSLLSMVVAGGCWLTLLSMVVAMSNVTGGLSSGISS